VAWLRTIDNCKLPEDGGSRSPRQQQQSKQAAGAKRCPVPGSAAPPPVCLARGPTAGNCYQRLIIGLGRLTSHASSLYTTAYVAAPTITPLSSLWCEAVDVASQRPAGSSKQRWLRSPSPGRGDRSVAVAHGRMEDRTAHATL
jgi:hypothetical protein